MILLSGLVMAHPGEEEGTGSLMFLRGDMGAAINDTWGNYDVGKDSATTDASYPSFDVNGDSSPTSININAGDCDINAAVPATFDDGNGYTICMWQKHSACDSDFLFRFSIAGAQMYALGDASNNLDFRQYDGGSNCNLNDIHACGTQWTHICYKWNDAGDDELSVHVNGTEWGNVTCSAMASSTNYANLGGGEGGAQPWAGLIDHVMVWSKALPDDNITALFEYGSPIAGTPPAPTVGDPAINVTIQFPTNGTKFIGRDNFTQLHNLYINLTHNASANSTQKFNITWNDTRWDFECNNENSFNCSGFNNTFLPDGYYSIEINITKNHTMNGSAYVNFEILTTSDIINVTIGYPFNHSVFGLDNILQLQNLYINVTHNESSVDEYGTNDSRFTMTCNNVNNYNCSLVNNTALANGNITIALWVNFTKSQNGSAYVTFKIDVINPSIEENFVNGTIIYNNNLTAKFNFTDDTYLWSFNISIDNLIVANKSGITGTKYGYNLSHYIGNYGIGEHIIKVDVADGHTAEFIQPYTIKKGLLNNYLKYEFGGGDYVKISSGLFDRWDTEKLRDRYIFDLKPNSKSNKYKLTIESNKEIHIVESDNTAWKSWLIIGNHWLDFVNDENATYRITKVKPNKVEVEVMLPKVLDKEKIRFNSIGDLNVVTKYFSFNIYNVSTTEQELILEREVTTYTLNITKNDSSVTTNANFIYNGVYYSAEKTSSNLSDYYIIDISHITSSFYNTSFQFNWSLNVTKGDTLKYQINGSNFVWRMFVGGCNDSINESTINFTVQDANTNEYIDDYNFEAAFAIWNGNTSYIRTYGFDLINRNRSNAICIFPWFANYTTDYDTLFSRTNYEDTHYIIADGTLNSTTSIIPIYLVNSTLTTDIKVEIVDENDDPLQSYIVEAHRYNLATDDYTLIVSQYTDSDGKVLLSLDVSTYEYRFIIKNPNGVVVKTVAKQKLIDTEYKYQIIIGTTPDVIILNLYSLNVNLEADRITKDFNLSWSEINYAANSIRLEILRANSTNGTRRIYNQTSTTNTGKMSYHVTENTNNVSVTFIANVWLNSSTDNKEYFIESETMDFRKEWTVFGTKESVMISFILIGTLIFMGLAVGAETAIILAIIGFVISSLTGLLIISLSSLFGLLLSFIILLIKMRSR